MATLRDSKGGIAYGCERRRGGCVGGQVAVHLAEVSLDAQLERVLGDLETLLLLLEASTRDAARAASESARQLGRRLHAVEMRRARARDAYEAGVYDLLWLRKREETLDGERAAVEALMDAEDLPEIDQDVAADLVEVFASWSHLASEERCQLLAAWGIEIVAQVEGRKRRRVLRIDRVRIGSPVNAWVYNYVPALPGDG